MKTSHNGRRRAVPGVDKRDCVNWTCLHAVTLRAITCAQHTSPLVARWCYSTVLRSSFGPNDVIVFPSLPQMYGSDPAINADLC